MDYREIHELYHHGIKGQKWGVENGPPYPLDYDDHTAEQKRLNPKSTIDGEPGKSRKEIRKEKRDARIDRKITKIERKKDTNTARVNEYKANVDDKRLATAKRKDYLKKYAEADLEYTEVYNNYRIASLNKKKNPDYVNTSEYKKAEADYKKQVKNDFVWGREMSNYIAARQKMGDSEKVAKGKAVAGTVAAVAAVTAFSVLAGYAQNK